MKHSAFTSLRRAFVAGVIVLTPIGVTVFVLSWLVNMIGGRYSRYLFFWLPEDLLNKQQLALVWNIAATIIVLLAITLLGFLSRYVVTRFFFNAAEKLMRRVPLISVIYTTVKQIVDTFSAQQRAVFDKVVLVPFPREGSYAIGFLTSRSGGEVQARTAEDVWNVFIPTTPNPTSGFLILVPRQQIRELDMTVGEGMKLIISGGAVVPPWPPAEPAAPGVPPRPGDSEAPGADSGTGRTAVAERGPHPEPPPSSA
ncbi:MAG: DUF502 domain-containing protein [Verrucomicrobia bacterium]|nr:MAG: DUF502 domain-containing protein [Verrucomicrobiota bacterium]